MNEPAMPTVGAWVVLHQQYVDEIRATGFANPIVLDAIGDAEDASWDADYLVNYGTKVHCSNCAYAIHNYGSYQDAAGYAAHLDAIQARRDRRDHGGDGLSGSALDEPREPRRHACVTRNRRERTRPACSPGTGRSAATATTSSSTASRSAADRAPAAGSPTSAPTSGHLRTDPGAQTFRPPSVAKSMVWSSDGHKRCQPTLQQSRLHLRADSIA